MRWCLNVSLFILAWTGTDTLAGADEHDFYLLYMTGTGEFSGFHEILVQPKPGYREVVYCERRFWVRDATVLWAEREAAAGHDLFIEAQALDDRGIYCPDADRQVTLESLGLSNDEIEQLRSGSTGEMNRASRIRSIRKAFQPVQ